MTMSWIVLWFKEQCALGSPLSGPIIKEKLKKLKPYDEIDF